MHNTVTRRLHDGYATVARRLRDGYKRLRDCYRRLRVARRVRQLRRQTQLVAKPQRNLTSHAVQCCGSGCPAVQSADRVRPAVQSIGHQNRHLGVQPAGSRSRDNVTRGCPQGGQTTGRRVVPREWNPKVIGSRGGGGPRGGAKEDAKAGTRLPRPRLAWRGPPDRFAAPVKEKATENAAPHRARPRPLACATRTHHPRDPTS